MDLGLKNKVAIVNGASQGIGKAIALGLSYEGANVVITARTKKTLDTTAEEIEKITKNNVLPIQVDLNNKNEIEKMVKKAYEKFKGIDILINNIGGPPPLFFIDSTDDDWKKAVDQLLFSTIHCCQQVIPYMKRKNWGRIINMTSVAAKQPIQQLILSNTIRSGLLGFTKTISNELADSNILVNAVCPGYTLTERVVELAESLAKHKKSSYEQVLSEWERAIPLHRLAEPEEIANLVTFLASDKASYMTGNMIQIDDLHSPRSLIV